MKSRLQICQKLGLSPSRVEEADVGRKLRDNVGVDWRSAGVPPATRRDGATRRVGSGLYYRDLLDLDHGIEHEVGTVLSGDSRGMECLVPLVVHVLRDDTLRHGLP